MHLPRFLTQNRRMRKVEDPSSWNAAAKLGPESKTHFRSAGLIEQLNLRARSPHCAKVNTSGRKRTEASNSSPLSQELSRAISALCRPVELAARVQQLEARLEECANLRQFSANYSSVNLCHNSFLTDADFDPDLLWESPCTVDT